MLPFGCTPAPYYARSAACAYRSGFHHGVDMAVRTGTVIKAGYAGRILDGSTMGPAYGANRFRLRATVNGVTKDFLIGHTAKNYVKVGQWVTAGQVMAVAGASGAPDGTHLHLEVRPVNGGLASAQNPYPYGRFAAVGSL
ncbi:MULTISPECIES: M23 family metallopeptidase [Arsenicicoccus]|uniref:M23 family metallopeptidase n=1 Tax=Arsenicicoccus TaxID=267408 RepID=UPI00257D9AA4|nr:MULTISPECIES: M23 family metallopeptidase [Arsenicicoccus]